MFQEQFKFVYETMEEYVVCGTSYFLVQQLSERLKAKSLKDKQTKKHPNEYEKEYSVSCHPPPKLPPFVFSLFVFELPLVATEPAPATCLVSRSLARL